MKQKQLLFVLLIALFGSLLTGCFKTPCSENAIIESIQKKIIDINEMQSLDLHTFPLEETSEGWELAVYYNREGVPIKIQIDSYWSQGLLKESYYLEDQKLFAFLEEKIIFKRDEKNQEPILDFENSKKSQYYFQDDKLIFSLGGTKTTKDIQDDLKEILQQLDEKISQTQDNLEENCLSFISKEIFSDPRFEKQKSTYDTLLTKVDRDENDLIGYYFSFDDENPDFYDLALVENYEERVVSVEHFQVNKKTGEICIYDVVWDSCDETISTDSSYSDFFLQHCNKLGEEAEEINITETNNSEEIYFYASGEEPFWNFTLQWDQLDFSSPNGDSKHKVIVNKNGEKYEISGEAITAEIFKKPCVDGGIGDTHEYRVNMSYESRELSGCADKAEG